MKSISFSCLALFILVPPCWGGVIDGKLRNSFIGDIAVIPRIGVFVPSEGGVDPALSVGGSGHCQLYSIDEGLSASVGMRYTAPRAGSGQIVVVPVDINAIYEVFVEEKTTELYFSGGFGLYPWSARFGGAGDSGLSFGFQIGAGAEPHIGPGNVLAGIEYSFAQARFSSGGIIDLGGLTLEVGYRIIF